MSHFFADRYTITVARLPSGIVFQVTDSVCGDSLVYQGQDLTAALQGHHSPATLAWGAQHLQEMRAASDLRRRALDEKDRADRKFRQAMLRGDKR